MVIKFVLIIALLYAAANWLIWKISFQAALLYLMESGVENIDADKIKEYREKVICKHFKIN